MSRKIKIAEFGVDEHDARDQLGWQTVSWQQWPGPQDYSDWDTVQLFHGFRLSGLRSDPGWGWQVLRHADTEAFIEIEHLYYIHEEVDGSYSVDELPRWSLRAFTGIEC